MSLKRDSVTDWARRNGEAIEKHRSQDVASRNKVPTFMNQSVFGLASQIPGVSEYTNSPYTLGLSPAALANGNWNLIRDRALTVGGNFLSNFINKSMTPENRKSLEAYDSDVLYGQFEGYRLNHKLEKVGYIGFAVDDQSIGTDASDIFDFTNDMLPSSDLRAFGYRMFKVPFFENPKITESRKPNYASHPIVNRNEPYRLWTAGNPMVLDIKFSITLPHLITFATEQLKKAILSDGLSRLYAEWLMNTVKIEARDAEDINPSGLGYITGFIDEFGSSEGNILRTLFARGDATNDVYKLAKQTMKDISQSINGPIGENSRRGDVILYVLGLINLIRSSVIGDRSQAAFNMSQTYIPPSLAYLKFGSLYQDFPCIVTNYNITFDGKAGYEEISLIPRVIDISLRLESYQQFSTSINKGLNSLTPPPLQRPQATGSVIVPPASPTVENI